MQLLDAYGHVALPRFMSADEYLRVMDDNDVERAHICTSETCPDLAELSRAAVAYPDRFLVSGLPLGNSPQEKLDSVRAQLDSGFIGLRISEQAIADQPELLDALGKAGGTPFVVGAGGYPAAAGLLHRFLERYPSCMVCAPHFAGVADPAIFDRNEPIRRLFGHERFIVIFSRHGAFASQTLLPWAREVIRRVGWSRIMFGSEYPVALFRDETYASTTGWVDGAGIAVSDRERRNFLYDNARRLLFSRPASRPRPLDSKWFRMDLRTRAPVWLFPNGTLDIPEATHRTLLCAYLAQGGERGGSYRDFIVATLGRAADDSPGRHT